MLLAQVCLEDNFFIHWYFQTQLLYKSFKINKVYILFLGTFVGILHRVM